MSPSPLPRLRGNGLSAKLHLMKNALHRIGTSVQSLLWGYISCLTMVDSTNCCSLPTLHVLDGMISYIESMWTLNMTVVQSIGDWDLDFAPFRPLTYILASCCKVSEIDSQWLKSQQNDHKEIIFDLNNSRSCSTQCFTSENHPRSISQLKFTITVEIRPL